MQKEEARRLLLSPKEAAYILRVSERTVVRLLATGKIPAQKINRKHWRVARDYVEEYRQRRGRV